MHFRIEQVSGYVDVVWSQGFYHGIREIKLRIGGINMMPEQ